MYELVSLTTLGWVESGVVCNAAFRALRNTCGPVCSAIPLQLVVCAGRVSWVNEAALRPAESVLWKLNAGPAEGGDKMYRHTIFITHVYSHVVVVIVIYQNSTCTWAIGAVFSALLPFGSSLYLRCGNKKLDPPGSFIRLVSPLST